MVGLGNVTLETILLYLLEEKPSVINISFILVKGNTRTKPYYSL